MNIRRIISIWAFCVALAFSSVLEKLSFDKGHWGMLAPNSTFGQKEIESIITSTYRVVTVHMNELLRLGGEDGKEKSKRGAEFLKPFAYKLTLGEGFFEIGGISVATDFEVGWIQIRDVHVNYKTEDPASLFNSPFHKFFPAGGKSDFFNGRDYIVWGYHLEACMISSISSISINRILRNEASIFHIFLFFSGPDLNTADIIKKYAEAFASRNVVDPLFNEIYMENIGKFGDERIYGGPAIKKYILAVDGEPVRKEGIDEALPLTTVNFWTDYNTFIVKQAEQIKVEHMNTLPDFLQSETNL